MRKIFFAALIVVLVAIPIASVNPVLALSPPSITSPSTPSYALSSGDVSYPNPPSPNITLSGLTTSVVVSPTCALSTPPCAVADSPVYYLTVNGLNYRLIFPNSIKVPPDGAHILITGVFVTPSTFKASLWKPQIYFNGDIYVLAYSYISPYY